MDRAELTHDDELKRLMIRQEIKRCRELYDTEILMDRGRNPFVQSVFIEIMVRLRNIAHHLLGEDGVPEHLRDMRVLCAHPEIDRFIGNTRIHLEFSRNFKGNWVYERGENMGTADDMMVPTDNKCDIEIQSGSVKVLVKGDIGRWIGEFEKEFNDKMAVGGHNILRHLYRN